MNHIIVSSTTSATEIGTFIHRALELGCTHFRFLKDGGKRSTIHKAPEFKNPGNGMITMGHQKPGLPFEALEIAAVDTRTHSEVAANVVEFRNPEGDVKATVTLVNETKPKRPRNGRPDKDKPKVKSVAPRKVDPIVAPRRGSGYIAYIDELLLTPGTPHGEFQRSKYTVDQAVEAVMKKFPGKNPLSVKRVIKVRPRHLERAKTFEQFDDAKPETRCPRWAFVGPGHGSGFMARIDELLMEGKLTTPEIAKIVAEEFHREYKDVRDIVQIRPSHLRKYKGKKVPFRRLKPARKPGQLSKRAALKAKNLALASKKKK